MTSQLMEPELWDKLEQSPETAPLLKDPSFKAILDELKTNPSSLVSHISDPRVLKVFSVLAKASASTMPTDGNAGSAPSTTIVEDEGETNESTTRGDVDMTGSTDLPNKKPKVEKEAVKPELSTPAERALAEKERGTAAYKRRDFVEAITAYTEAIKLDGDNIALLTNRAAAKLESGDVDGCIEDCQTAITENAEKHLRSDFKLIARAYGRMGNAYLKKDDFDNAIKAFEKSLLESHDPKVSRALKDAELAKKKKEEEAYLNPEISKEVRAEGNKLFLAGQFPESIAKYSEAIKRNPKDAAPYSNRAAAYMKLGEFPMAMKDCDKCLEIDPVFVKAYIRKGNIHFFMKEYHKCLTVYEKGLKLAPENKELRQGLMKTNMKIQEQQSTGEVDEAQMKQAMSDPEIQQILQDPQMNTLLTQMQEDPKFAAQAMRDPSVSSKVQKLIASGFLRVG